MALALALSLPGITPAQAQHDLHPFHNRAIPTICDNCLFGGSASAQWVNDPNHFHQVLNLEATACGQIPPPSLINQRNVATFAGAQIKDLGQTKVHNFSFDYKAQTCNGFDGFFVLVFTNKGVFEASCGTNFPASGGVFKHVSLSRSSLNIPSDAQFDFIYIGIGNDTNTSETAQVKNISINGIPCIDVMKPASAFCPVAF
jgi:hypothetical protein